MKREIAEERPSGFTNCVIKSKKELLIKIWKKNKIEDTLLGIILSMTSCKIVLVRSCSRLAGSDADVWNITERINRITFPKI